MAKHQNDERDRARHNLWSGTRALERAIEEGGSPKRIARLERNVEKQLKRYKEAVTAKLLEVK